MILSGSTESEETICTLSVAVPRPLEGLFTYKLPARLAPHVRVGGYVKVPFGKSILQAFVVEPPRDLSELPPGVSLEQLKEVLEVGDSDQCLPADVLALCNWAREYYSVPLGEVLNCASPTSIMSSSSAKRASKPRSPSSKSKKSDTPLVLTQEQESALNTLEQYQSGERSTVALLQGVTGSGKTEIYIELARKALSEGRGVLILVPEIALTPQLHRRFEERLGISVALWHSAISPARRRNQSIELRKGSMRAVVGARSAVFAPIQNLGLVVVDEEHDPTYKQEDRVRYQARDLAIVRAKLTNAFIVLGSATPSLETRERVREGRYRKAVLDKRIALGGFPRIELVDLLSEKKVEDIQAPLALKTLQAIQETIDAGEQVIIYLNKRGFASFLLCKECGEVKGCPQCSVSLTVHKRYSELRCHLCGHKEPIPDFCKTCQGTDLYPIGAGTESLETELPNLISGAKVLRLDRDQITSASRLEKVLDEFRNKSANILLGTQMLVKGHDFPGVTLVVVVLADSLFRWPDFRAPERAYQILKQVSGRSGRGEKPGKVLVQTFDTQHPVLQTLDERMSEEAFLEGERDLRQVLMYPPFGRLARLRFESASREEAVLRSNQVAQYLNQAPIEDQAAQILGPSEAFLERVKGVFRWDLLIKARNVATLHKLVLLARGFCASHKWRIIVDVDPYAN